MKSPPSANVVIHPSQFPENIRRDLLQSLQAREINHKFHYDSVKQTQKWLALHQIYSPSRNDADCAATYNRAFAEAVKRIKTDCVHVVGLGCGGGQKDTRLLKLLKSHGKKTFYTPSDVSAAMILTARRTALKVLPEENCFPFVCDLVNVKDLQKLLIARHSSLVTFFGMIPNFEPQIILPKLASLIRPKDYLLFSANLAPGKNYDAGMKKILPQYDNAPTRDWLMAFLFDLGVEQKDGQLKFTIKSGAFGLKRVVARFYFRRSCKIGIESEQFEFRRGESIRLFFSYRYTPEHVRKTLAKYRLQVVAEWITKSEEEGVFLCRRVK